MKIYFKFLFCLVLSGISALADADIQANSVHFHAWGGSPQINAYIQWVADEVKTRHNINLIHVKLGNTSDAVNLVLSQKLADGQGQTGTVDLLWLNGENFASMAEHDLLHDDWVTSLSNYALTNPSENSDITYDFGVPTLGRESPWGRASLLFYFNSEHVEKPPSDIQTLLDWARVNPYRFTYPNIDDFIGISFIKYAWLATTKNADNALYEILFRPYSADEFASVTAPLWNYLDTLHPWMWRQGDFFVKDNGWLKRLFDDEEILLALTFSAGDIPASVDRYELPVSTRSYTMADGSLSNVHFVTIPFNAPNKVAAMQVANFLLSPLAQSEKAKGVIWGDSTVLDIEALDTRHRALFQNISNHPSALDSNKKIMKLKEPHPSWIRPLKQAWKERYGSK